MSVSLDNLEPIDVRPIKRALISVYDKTGLEDLARALGEAGVEIVSTGSTAARIAAAGVAVTPVDDVTGFPEVLEGRVKTLHPFIHSGILADQRKAAHREQIAQLGIKAFDLVVCNLYPFQDTVASGASFDECVEQIDIGGPSMVRAAAKNHPSVAVVTSPERYADVAQAVAGEGFTLEQRRALAAEAFAHTATYDLAIAGWFADELDLEDVREALDEAAETHLDASDAAFLESLGYQAEEDYVVEAAEEDGQASGMPVFVADAFERVESLRYGENPHQGAAVYREIDESFEDEGADDEALAPGIANARQLHGKAMSYNNYVDADAALRAAYDFDEPAVAVIKHNNPCGIAVATPGAADPIADAHAKAHACDPLSAYGGVIAANRPVTAEMARTVKGIFTEVVVAPGYEPEALEILREKKNLRLLVLPEGFSRDAIEYRPISGGALFQEADRLQAEGDDPKNWTLVAGEPADEATLRDLEFAWRALRSPKSNAILLADNGAAVGIGMGQVNRVDSCKLSVERANTLGGEGNERARGAVAASDAFFPFADGLQVLLDAGVRAVVHPGGSIRDEEVIEAAKAAGVTMYLTGTRHFFH